MTLLAGVMLLLLTAGVPVAFAVAAASVVFLFAGGAGIDSIVLAQKTVSGANMYILLAVPFFMLAGELMNQGGITQRLVSFAEALVGALRGGLAYVVVLVNMIMAGVSGAAIADAAAVGSVMIPTMKRKGYPPGFAAAVNAASATVGPVIPPSVGFIIYASVANDPSVSVGRMFLAGAIPGVVLGLIFFLVCFLASRKLDLPRGPRRSTRGLLRATRDAAWALVMPVIILGGILGGIVTPTEAGVIAVLYGLFVGCVVYRQIRLADLPYLLAKSAKQSAVILFVIACAKPFGWFLTYINAPEMLTATFTSVSDQAWVFLLVLNAAIVILGCFMEGGSIMIILTPLLLPALRAYGVDLVHFGVVFQLNIMIGLLTPPLGMLLYVITGVSGVRMGDILKHLWPFLFAIAVVLLLITFAPPITLWLPGVVD